MANFLGLLHGMVFKTNVESFTGEFLYSDFATGREEKDTTLNTLTKIPFIGIVAGIARVALGIIHTIGHLIAALVTGKKGHLFHAAKGICEILRGTIEATPIIGRIFSNSYNSAPINNDDSRASWWMIKIYNKEKPDGLDKYMGCWDKFPRAFTVTDSK